MLVLRILRFIKLAVTEKFYNPHLIISYVLVCGMYLVSAYSLHAFLIETIHVTVGRVK